MCTGGRKAHVGILREGVGRIVKLTQSLWKNGWWGRKSKKGRGSESRFSKNKMAWKVENKIRGTFGSRHFINCNLKIQGHCNTEL